MTIAGCMVRRAMVWWNWVFLGGYLIGLGFGIWRSFWAQDAEESEGWFAAAFFWPAIVAVGALIYPTIWVGEAFSAWRKRVLLRANLTKEERAAASKKAEENRAAEKRAAQPEPKDLIYKRSLPIKCDPLADDDAPDPDGYMIYRDPVCSKAFLELILKSAEAREHQRLVVTSEDLKEFALGLLQAAKVLDEGGPYR